MLLLNSQSKETHLTKTTLMLMSWWHHLFQHVLQSLCLKVNHKLLLLSSVQILQQSSVIGIIEVFDADGTDLPVVLSCLLHDGLQDGVS